MLEPRAGECALDLYCGVGLFAGALGERLGSAGSVVAVESAVSAISDARRNLHDLPWVRLVEAPVEQWIESAETDVDLVVLDPPRSGARRRVVEAVARLRPRAIAYVACDPAALARDLAYFADAGYRLAKLEAYDLFPMTHHVETVALVVPVSADDD
jgi:tRNA/tmRNA/rRNA uracil-C5-methylase (TrmA/RlmC/RlmD family)